MAIMFKKQTVLTLVVSILIAFLSIEVVLLIVQNRKLQARLTAMTPQQQREPLKVGEYVEPAKLTSLDGKHVSFDYHAPADKYLFFIFSTTCPHCERNLHNWTKIAEKNRDNHCIITGVSVSDLPNAVEYNKSKRPNFPVFAATDTSFLRLYKVPGVPETIIVGANGRVEKAYTGELQDQQVEEIERSMGLEERMK